jgi:Phage derived protein Gp49-like (DUF891)
MESWIIRCYLDDRGNDVIDAWLSGKPQKVLAKFLDRMGGLRDQPQHRWNGTRTKQLTGYEGLVEVRFKAAKVQYRPIGFFGPGRMEFTLLVGAIEKGGEFIPKNAPDVAQERKAIVIAQPERTHVCDF